MTRTGIPQGVKIVDRLRPSDLILRSIENLKSTLLERSDRIARIMISSGIRQRDIPVITIRWLV